MNELEQFLRGRIWLRHLMPFSEADVDAAISSGAVSVIKGISDERQCMRCLETSPSKIIPFNCAKCNAVCYYCRHCIRMGRVSSCTQLLTWHTPSSIHHHAPQFAWKGILTTKQQKASNDIITSLKSRRSHLVYAVCGAGKTELLFPPIHQALLQGKRICLAAPRTDVVLELSPRIKAAFPDTIVHTLYGGSPEQAGYSRIVLATTHQLYRFQHAFDLMILDEADAFPYSLDMALQRAVQKAKLPDAPVVYVSATPSRHLLRTVAARSEIFERYHGFSLPEPAYRPLWNYKKQFAAGKIPERLRHWLMEKIAKEEPFLLFLPTIELIESTAALFKGIDQSIETVHAEDPDRKQKVLQLRNGKIPGLICSTILERGITIANVQVAVVGADEDIFHAAALIQIAGRAGRSGEFPAGDVVFFHNGISRAMDEARRAIQRYNRRDRR